MRARPSPPRSGRTARRQKQRSGRRFGLKQFGLMMGVVVLSLMMALALALLEPGGSQRLREVLGNNSQPEQFSPTPMGPGLDE